MARLRYARAPWTTTRSTDTDKSTRSARSHSKNHKASDIVGLGLKPSPIFVCVDCFWGRVGIKPSPIVRELQAILGERSKGIQLEAPLRTTLERGHRLHRH